MGDFEDACDDDDDDDEERKANSAPPTYTIVSKKTAGTVQSCIVSDVEARLGSIEWCFKQDCATSERSK